MATDWILYVNGCSACTFTVTALQANTAALGHVSSWYISTEMHDVALKLPFQITDSFKNCDAH